MGLTEQDGYMVTPSTDRFTGFGVEISGDHAYIHKGLAFSAIGSTSLAAAATYGLTLTTPAASVAYVHLRPALFSSSASYTKITLIEAPTFTPGTAGTPINRNRNSSRASTCTYAFGATYTSGGTVLDMTSVGSGGNPSARTGGSTGADAEIVLKPSTTYFFLIDNPTGGATSTEIWNLLWYEEDMGA